MTDATNERADESAHIKITHVLGYKLVAGLAWEKLDLGKSYMAEARERGKELGMDIVAIRKGAHGQMQAGFAPKGRGADKNMYSMASVVSAVAGPDSLVAFQLDDGQYGLVGTLDDLIVAGCDAIGNREEIEELFRDWHARASSANRTWKRVAAPAEFEFSDDRFDVYAMLDKHSFTKAHRLQQLHFGLSRHEFTRYGLIAGGLVAFAVIAMWGRDYLSKKAEAERKAEKEKIDQINAAATPPTAPAAALPHPWASQPVMAQFIDMCTQVSGRWKLSVAGWVLDTRKCTNGNFGATYKDPAMKSEGTQDGSPPRTLTIPWTLFALRANAVYGVVPTPVDDTATAGGVGGSFEPVPSSDADTLTDSQTARMDFLHHFQVLGMGADVKLDTQDSSIEKPKDGQPAAVNAPKPEWHTYNFTITTLTPPPIAFAGLSGDGVRVTEIKSTLDKAKGFFTYEITGSVYAR